MSDTTDQDSTQSEQWRLTQMLGDENSGVPTQDQIDTAVKSATDSMPADTAESAKVEQ